MGPDTITCEDDLAHAVDMFGSTWCETDACLLDSPQAMGWGDDPHGWTWCPECRLALEDEDQFPAAKDDALASFTDDHLGRRFAMF